MMKQFNRFAAVLLSAVMLLTLAACGEKPDDTADTSAPTDAAQSAAQSAAAETPTEDDAPLTRPADDEPLTREEVTDAPIDVSAMSGVEVLLGLADGTLSEDLAASMLQSLEEDGGRFIRNADGTASLVDESGTEMKIGQWPDTGVMAAYPKPASGRVGLWVSESGGEMVVMVWTAADAKAYAEVLKAQGFTAVLGETEQGGEYSFMAMNAAAGLMAVVSVSAAEFENNITIADMGSIGD